MCQPKFPEFWVKWKAPLETLDSAVRVERIVEPEGEKGGGLAPPPLPPLSRLERPMNPETWGSSDQETQKLKSGIKPKDQTTLSTDKGRHWCIWHRQSP